ncbi:MAG: DUF4147 domain-containing protein [Gemmatimonadales bacterium]|nr:MAG: DUF4147 domain-containing protein [Gemmatimonadales bacterium]
MSREQLRGDAIRILQGGLAAVDPVRLVAGALVDDPELADWVPSMALESRASESFRSGARPSAGRTVLVAVGKAALTMTRGALQVLGDAIDTGVVLVPHPTVSEGSAPGMQTVGEPGGVRSVRPPWLPARILLRSGGHPVPDESGRRAAAEISELAGSLGAEDRLLALISGGGSALLTLPRPGLPLAALGETTSVLLEAGLPIQELNQVRTHLEELKGGGLARRAQGARILGLVLSDVVGDDPGVVASGPLSPRERSGRQVEILLRRRGIWNRLPGQARDLIRSADQGEQLVASDPVTAPEPVVRIVGGGATALEGARLVARRLGYHTHVLTTELSGEARRAGRGLAQVGLAVRSGLAEPHPPACVLAAGETTVTVKGQGRGGRNQEVALGAAGILDGEADVLVASLGTDGVDGPTDAAGAVADGRTVARAAASGFEVASALEENDAYPLLDALGDLIRTGPTGTNVADLMLVLVSDGYTHHSD